MLNPDTAMELGAGENESSLGGSLTLEVNGKRIGNVVTVGINRPGSHSNDQLKGTI